MERLPSTRQLQHLVKLAENPHMSEAAAALGITQPSLSASIKELETTLGAPVLERLGKRLKLTPLGAEVAGRAGVIVAHLEELTQLARESAEPLAGTLRLGVIPTISAFLLPRLLPVLRQRYPKLKVYLIEDQSAHLIAALERGELDVLLLALPYRCSGETAVLARDPFVVALRRDHKLARQKKIAPAQLRQEKILTLQDGHCLRDQSLAACGLVTSSDERYAATSLHTLVQMVDNGLGLTLLPQLAVKAGLLEGLDLVTRPLEGDTAWRDIALLWRAGASRSSELELLATELKRILKR